MIRADLCDLMWEIINLYTSQSCTSMPSSIHIHICLHGKVVITSVLSEIKESSLEFFRDKYHLKEIMNPNFDITDDGVVKSINP